LLFLLLNNNNNNHHRRNQTETINVSRKNGRHFSSPQEEIEKNLKNLQQYGNIISNEKFEELKQHTSNIKYEEEYHKTVEKLKEVQDERNEAVEIIGNLENENEELKMLSSQLKDDYDRIGTELKILEQKNLALEQVYQQDKQDSNKNA